MGFKSRTETVNQDINELVSLQISLGLGFSEFYGALVSLEKHGVFRLEETAKTESKIGILYAKIWEVTNNSYPLAGATDVEKYHAVHWTIESVIKSTEIVPGVRVNNSINSF